MILLRHKNREEEEETRQGRVGSGVVVVGGGGWVEMRGDRKSNTNNRESNVILILTWFIAVLHCWKMKWPGICCRSYVYQTAWLGEFSWHKNKIKNMTKSEQRQVCLQSRSGWSVHLLFLQQNVYNDSQDCHVQHWCWRTTDFGPRTPRQ